jgi:hypothetical protein
MSALIFISRIEDTFETTGRGMVLIPSIPDDGKKYVVQIGDSLEVRKPDGQRLITTVAGIEMCNSPKRFIPLLLPTDVRKEDVPVGSELWHLSIPQNLTAD